MPSPDHDEAPTHGGFRSQAVCEPWSTSDVECQILHRDDVQDRLGALSLADSPFWNEGRHATPTPASAAAAAMAALAQSPEATKDVFEPRFAVSFRAAVTGAIILAVLLSCGGMFVPLEVYTNRLRDEAVESCSRAMAEQRMVLRRLVYGNMTQMSYTNVLRSVTTALRRSVKDPSEQAVDALWGSMRTWNRFDPSWTGESSEQGGTIEYNAWVQLSSQQTAARHADALYVGFGTGQLIGVSLVQHGDSPTAVYMDAPGWGGPLDFTPVQAAGERSEQALRVEPGFAAHEQPFFAVQRRIAETVVAGSAAPRSVRAWSRLGPLLGGGVGLSWTAPVAYCGDYSCLRGVLAADVDLRQPTRDCHEQWERLRHFLASQPPGCVLAPENSSVFVVSHVSRRFPEQQGLLIGTSHEEVVTPGRHGWDGLGQGVLVQATGSPHRVVAETATALLERFGSWDNPELLEEQMIGFHLDLLGMIGNRRGQSATQCDPAAPNFKDDDKRCQQVGTLSLEMDEDTRWLVVVTLPMGAFTMMTDDLNESVSPKVQDIQKNSQLRVDQARTAGLTVFFGSMSLSVVLGFGIGFMVSRPLGKLSKLMRRLGDLDFAHESREFLELCTGHRSRIIDVSQLQHTFCRLSRGIEAFARFVPDTVVRNIVRGDPSATRLHVSRREVTIMFSDIRDFTTITETLTQRDLLFVLTRYLSVMTRIVELFEGVVAEILGDGLLVFWNTPDDVEDHAAKGCAAALAQQQALTLLNAELGRLGLPQLAIRIGLHTGVVLSGNIGSSLKMKFGCLGDPVNIASRLEGLCKHYGVGVICSGATFLSLPPGSGFVSRKLDLVQVKDKMEPTPIYEVIGRECCGSGPRLQGDFWKRSSSDIAAAVSGVDVESGEGTDTGDGSVPPGARSKSAAVLEAMQQPLPPLCVERFLLAPVQRLLCWFSMSSHTGADNSPGPGRLAFVSGDAAPALFSAYPGVSGQSKDVVAPEQRRRAGLYEAALAAFQQARFVEARSFALELLAEDPEDVAGAKLLERAERHIGPDGQVIRLSEEVLIGWTGVHLLTDK